MINQYSIRRRQFSLYVSKASETLFDHVYLIVVHRQPLSCCPLCYLLAMKTTDAGGDGVQQTIRLLRLPNQHLHRGGLHRNTRHLGRRGHLQGTASFLLPFIGNCEGYIFFILLRGRSTVSTSRKATGGFPATKRIFSL